VNVSALADSAGRLRRFPRPTLLETVYLLGGAVLSVVYAWWMDDAFIYFRYVDNLLFLDIGLVYNAGEYVEGYSSPLWILILIPLRALGLEWRTIVLGFGLFAYACFGALLVALNRRLASGPQVNFPLAVLSFTYGVLCYFTSGLETALVQISAVAYALFVLAPGSRALAAFLGVGPLIRHELLVPLVVVALWARWRTGRTPWFLAGSCFASLAAWGLVRVVYYAELLPNTFYLKHGSDAGQGWVYLQETLATYRVVPLAALALVALVALRLARVELRLLERAVMLLAAFTVAAYVVRIGGDARHYRYLAFPFCLAICALAGIPEALVARFLPAGQRGRASVLLGIAIAAAAFSAFPPQLDRHPITGRSRHRNVNRISDADVHRQDPGGERSGRTLGTPLTPPEWTARVTPEAMRDFARREPEFRYRGTVAKLWCAEAYRLFDRRIVQSFGLTDPFLARTAIAALPADRPAHKHALLPLAEDLVELLRARADLGPGMFREAVENGTAPGWVARNLEALETIARKAYNRHALGENLRLAFTFPPRIAP
jgi:hypothetical protein